MMDSAFFPATSMPDDDWWQALWPDPMDALVKIGIAPGMSVIDLCCGNGIFTIPLVSLVGEKGRVIAIDMDADMLSEARSRMARVTNPVQAAVCDWMEADACKIDTILDKKDAADALIIANTYHGVPDQAGLSLAVSRVLKPTGRFIIINWHTFPREETVILDQPRGPKTQVRMSPDSVARSVAAAGFVLKEVVELSPYHYGAVFHIA